MKLYIFILFLSIFAQGCATEYNLATGREETLMFSTEKEINMGANVSAQLEQHYKINTELDLNERVNTILNKIVCVCDRKELIYFIKIIDEDILNAVSLPGGYIYIFKGALDKIKNDDELAAIIAHEVGHITARHSIKKIQGAYGALIFQLLSIEAGRGNVAGGVNLAINSIFSAYSQQDEFEADRLSIKYLKKAGYNPQGVIKLLEKLQIEQEKAPLRPLSFWRTHPYISQRIAKSREELTGKLEYRDYLNLINIK